MPDSHLEVAGRVAAALCETMSHRHPEELSRLEVLLGDGHLFYFLWRLAGWMIRRSGLFEHLEQFRGGPGCWKIPASDPHCGTLKHVLDGWSDLNSLLVYRHFELDYRDNVGKDAVDALATALRNHPEFLQEPPRAQW